LKQRHARTHRLPAIATPPRESEITMSPNLDLVRAVAILLVVASHVFIFAVGTESLPWFSRRALGHVGVAMFFVHTTLVLLQSLERHDGGALPFLVRRLFRIYPLSLAVVLLMAGAMLAAGSPPSLLDFLSNVFLVQNLTGTRPMPSPLWTLPFEVQMYLTLPVIYAATRTPLALRRVVCLWCAALVLALAGGAWRGIPGLPETSLISLAPCFLPGALAFVLRGPGQRSPLLLVAVLAVGATAIPVAVAFGAAETPALWLLSIALGLSIPQCRELTAKPVAVAAKIIAKYSYAVYLLHTLVLAIAFRAYGIAGPLEWLIFALLLTGFSFLAYHIIEAPGIALGARLAARLNGLRISPQKRTAAPARDSSASIA
jgi:peptidoglycan/LPS O-acetylase OafA/YrhL